MNILHFGKWKGHSVKSVPIDYALWLVSQKFFRDAYPETYPIARNRVMKHFEAEQMAEAERICGGLV